MNRVGTDSSKFDAISLNESRDTFEYDALREIQDWYHQFFLWSRGGCPQHDSYVTSIYESLAPDFRVWLTHGQMMDKREYWSRLLSLYGARAGSPPSQIVNLKTQRMEEDHLLVTFELVKEDGSARKFDSAVMRREPSAPGGVVWLYVHESVH